MDLPPSRTSVSHYHHHHLTPSLSLLPPDAIRYLPTVSWNIDSFGHTTGNSGVVLGLNYSSQVLNRVSYDIKSLIQRHALYSFEYLPELLSHKFDFSTASPTENPMSITTTILPFHYSSPGPTDEHLRSLHLSKSKLEQIRYSLLHSLSRQLGDCVKLGTKDCDVMILLGNDMTYAGYASRAYHNLDSVISSLNDRTVQGSPSLRGLVDFHKYKLEAFYSTPGRYFASKKHQIHSKKIGKGHFVPYSDSLWNDWTGFYGSRPLLKAKIRYILCF